MRVAVAEREVGRGLAKYPSLIHLTPMAGPFDRLKSALSDRYAIERELGAGGMATVYLAQDLKHKRRVALKVLRPELAAVLGAERFLKEIEVTANLQHPNILPLYDSGTAGHGDIGVEVLYYVMPYVEGETLRDRLNAERQLPVDDTIEITKAVAAALQFAHERGVIHRDIKPENVLFQSGQAIVADFGIALAVSHAGGARITETGLSLGTPHYMSPEQASGDRTLDARSDVYSLGAMVYEMLTGEPPHDGNTAQAIIARILTSEPEPIGRTRSRVPANVDAAVQKALAKAPADRFKSVATFVDALMDPHFAFAGPAPATARAPKRGFLVGAGALGGLLVGWLAAVTLGGSPQVDSAGVTMRQVTFDGTVSFPSLSADGEWLAYLITRCPEREECRGELLIQEVDGGDPITRGTSVFADGEEHYPMWFWDLQWAPDGRSVLATAAFPDTQFNGLYLVPRVSGAPTKLAPGMITAVSYRPGTDTVDWIRFPKGLGAQEDLEWQTFDLVTREVTSRPLPFPATDLRWSPDGDWLAMVNWVGNWSAGINLVIVDRAGVVRDTARVPTPPFWPQVRWLKNGETIVIPSDDRLIKVDIDPRTGQLRGSPTELVAGMQPPGWGQYMDFDVTPDGRAIVTRYRVRNRLRTLTRQSDGRYAASWLETGTGHQDHPTVTSDGRDVAYIKEDARGLNLYVQSTAGGGARAITRTATGKRHPRWSPDGSRIAFIEVDSSDALTVVGRDGAGLRRVGQLSSVPTASPYAWAPDGRAMAFLFDGGVWWADLDGQEQRLLDVPMPITEGWGIGISPTGDSLALLSHWYAGGGGSFNQLHLVSRSDLQAGWTKVLDVWDLTWMTEAVEAATSAFVGWTQMSLQPWRDGGSLDIGYSSQTAGGELAGVRRVSLATGRARLQANLNAYCTGGLVQISATMDLSRIVCTDIDASRDVWVIENLPLRN